MLLKSDKQNLNMINITKRKLMNLANNAECFSTKIDNWVTSKNNYRKLRSSRISKSCQTMTDHPQSMSKSSYWSYEDTLLLENWMSENPEVTISSKDITKEIVADEKKNKVQEISELNFNSFGDEILFKNHNNTENVIQPIIRMDGDFIEVEYYFDGISGNHRDENHSSDNFCNLYVSNNNLENDENNQLEKNPLESCRQNRNKTNGSKNTTPKIPSYKIADTRGLSPRRCQKYCEFLVKYDDINNLPNFNNIPFNNEQSEDLNVSNHSEMNTFEFDDHRALPQILAESDSLESNLLKPERSLMYERGGSARVKTTNSELKSEIKSFLSFRCPNKKNKSDKKIRKRYVTSEEGVAGPIWPAVLLTYDKRVSSGSPDYTDE